MTLQQAIGEFDLALQGEVAERTRKTYLERLSHLQGHFGADADMASITASDLRRWRADLLERTERYSNHPYREPQKGALSRQTVKGLVKAAKRLFKFLDAEGVLPHNPAAVLRAVRVPPQAPKGITANDLLRLMEAAQGHARNYAIILFLADTGCRAAGLCGLDVADLDMTQRRAMVTEKGKVRPVFFGQQTCNALTTYLTERGSEPGPLWVARGGGRLHAEGVYRMLRRLGKRAGVERCNPHAFRHGLARGMLEEGANLALVAEVLGHEDVATTRDFYARWDVDEVARQKERYSWIPPATEPEAE